VGDSWTNKAVFGLCCDDSLHTFDHVLDSEWACATYSVMVDFKSCRGNSHDCAGGVLVHEVRNQGYPAQHGAKSGPLKTC